MVGAEMLIAFLHVGTDITQAQMMVNSAMRFGHECVQLTDADSPHIEGAHCIRFDRGDDGIMYFRARCYAAFNEPGIYMDTDMLVQRALSPVMALDFDAALTKRGHDIIDPNGVNVGALMPYNGGFVAVKDKTFWPEVADIMRRQDADSQRWYGDQIALAEAAKSRSIVELPIRIYNCTVKRADADVSRPWVLHFKGRGKDVMESYYARTIR